MSNGIAIDTHTVFGNKLSDKSIHHGRRIFQRYARKFGFDPLWSPHLVLREMPVAFEIFGIRQLLEGGIDPVGYVPGERNSETGQSATSIDLSKSIVLGTIRMGYGHYRIALSLASAARSMGLDPYWLDFLSFTNSPASRTIAYLEELYARFSRLSQQFKLFNRLIWERVTSDVSRKLSYCARDRELTRIFAPLIGDLPRELPFVSTHPWTGQAAVHAGMEHVVTVVPDNYPLAFHLVEGSVHAVQTPSAYLGYRSLRNMGEADQGLLNPIPEDMIRYTGHFVDHELVSNIEIDCEARFRRISDKKAKRILLTMGGAGAQMQRFSEIISFCEEGLREKKVSLWLNMGDHKGRWGELRTTLESKGIPYVLHEDWQETRTFAEQAGAEDVDGLHIFLNPDIFVAVYTTNLLMRHADLMITKPSELSFYPVPKMFIQRVGRHEAWGAIRGAEIGDGTLETQSANGIFQTLRIILQDGDLLHLYCTNIVKNKEIGIYDGAYNAIKIAIETSGKR